jgi:hypothetical protein
MEKRFVRLGDKFYVVEMDDKEGLKLVPATDKDILDEQFESCALLDLGTADIGQDNFLQEIINSTKDEMLKSLKHGLKKTVLRSLGFNDSGFNQGFEVDHCNGRMSEVSSHIAITIKDILKSATMDEIGISDEERQEIISSYKKDLLATYRRTLRDNMWRTVEIMAREDAKGVAEALVKDRSEQIGAIVLDKLFASTRKV